jgi:enoyl-CoA hydratase/carnithine racemase
MANFEDYRERYDFIRMERRDGILSMTFHTDGGSWKWTEAAHRLLPDAFHDVATDRENRVVIMTGTGDDFLTELAFEHRSVSPGDWDKISREGRRILFELLDIEVPVIAAINGPVTEHAEIMLLADIVIAADTAEISDQEHFVAGVVPGDGVHVIWPLLLGPNRGRHFLLTGRRLSAQEALDLGVVAEVHPQQRLVERAWEIAAQLNSRTMLTLRYTRQCLTMQLRRDLDAMLGHGLALESLAAVESRSFGGDASKISVR